MPGLKAYAKAALLRPGDVIRAWRGTRYVEHAFDRVELTPNRAGGQTGAYAHCTARVFIQGSDEPFYTGPANHIFEIKAEA